MQKDLLAPWVDAAIAALPGGLTAALHGELAGYLRYGRRPGRAIYALLTGPLRDAAHLGVSAPDLGRVAAWAVEHLPPALWGNAEVVDRWCARGGLYRRGLGLAA